MCDFLHFAIIFYASVTWSFTRQVADPRTTLNEQRLLYITKGVARGAVEEG